MREASLGDACGSKLSGFDGNSQVAFLISIQTMRRAYRCKWSQEEGHSMWLGRPNDTRQGFANPSGYLLRIGLAGIEPGDNRFDHNRRDKVSGPLRPRRVRNELYELAVRDGDHTRLERVNLPPKLWLSGGVLEEEPKTSRIRDRRLNQRAHTVRRIVTRAYRGHQPRARMIQRRPVEVGLGLEMTVEDDTTDTGLGGDIVEAGGGESAMGKRACGGGQNLLPARGAAEALSRRRWRVSGVT
jgi:hypothetical protein